jgi:hypothetical protein
MKTLTSKNKRHILMNSEIGNPSHLFPILIFLLLSILLSGSVSYPQKKDAQNDDSKSRSINILEKLENGKLVTTDEIASLFSSYKNNVSDKDMRIHEDRDIADLVNLPELPDLPDMPEIPSVSDDVYFHSSFDHHKVSHDVIVITDNEMKEIHKKLAESVEELKKNIESLRNSEDFYKIQEQLERWSENFKKDLKKMREDIVRSDKER